MIRMMAIKKFIIIYICGVKNYMAKKMKLLWCVNVVMQVLCFKMENI